jgi:glutathione synthase
MKFAFIADPLAGLKAYKDSTIAMMREAARRGHEVWAFEAREMYFDGMVCTQARHLAVSSESDDWYREEGESTQPLTFWDAVVMRKDPPFDLEYLYATQLLSAAEASGAWIVNSPRALRDWNEKLGILGFPQYAPRTLVSSDPGRLHGFIDAERDVVLKRLDGMGGAMIFRVRADDPNRNVIVETMSTDGARTVMAQRYLPEIAKGDKRVLVIDGKAVPFSLARIPKAGETRGNLAAGGRGVAQPLSARDREIAEGVAPKLQEAGILFAGLDVIGDALTEINVTSPTCMVEILAQAGYNAAKDFIDALERRPAPR